MDVTEAPPPLTIVIPTRRGWGPVVQRTYEAVRHQSLAHQAEVLVMDGLGSPPPAGTLAENVRWVELPDRSVHQLRNAGYRQARGDIVACVEDHAVPAPDWCEAILNAFQEWPDAAAIGGCVLNGDDARGVDRASFYAGHVQMVPPLPRGPAQAITAMHPTYRRDALHEVLGPAGEVVVDQFLQARMVERDMLLVTDDRIRATHHQALDLFRTALIHFHNGRAFNALRQEVDPRDAYLRAARSAVLPAPRTLRRLLTGYRRGEPPIKLVRTAPFLFWLLIAQAAGEVAGTLLGAGDSALELR